MKLTWRVEELRLRHTFAISRDSQDVARVVFAELESEGTAGVGEASPSAYYGETPETVAAALAEVGGWLAGPVAPDPRCYRRLLEEAAERLGDRRAALSALDLAVFDWFGKKHGIALYRLLGLDPERLPATSFTIGIDTPERMVEKLREAAAYPLIKVKVGMKDDVEIVRRLRKETRATFRVDANGAWTAREAIEKSKELASLGVEFIEQPLPPEEIEAMDEVYAGSALPLIADENAVVPEDVLKLRGKFHGINIKLVKSGGILPALRMVHLARTLGLKVMAGCMIESSVACTAAAQIGPLLDYLDVDGPLLITNDPYTGVEYRNGSLRLPPGPGLGVARRR